MTATLQPETKSSTRRALLAGALGGIGAWAASAIGRTSPMRAANGESVILGQANQATALTRITNTSVGGGLAGTGTNGGAGVAGISDSGRGVTGFSISDYGVWGSSDAIVGVFGQSLSGIAVSGVSGSGNGVNGTSSSGIGVAATSSMNKALYAVSSASTEPAALGFAFGNSTAVQGYSGTGTIPAPRPKTGVYGNANQDIFSTGVYGLSAVGVGVRGKTTSGYAGYFEGRVYTNAWYELGEVATPAAPLANRARLFVRDNGAGKTQLCVRFHTGVVRVLTTEP